MDLLLHGTLCLVILVIVVLSLSFVIVNKLPSSKCFPKWISVWLIITSVICTWDASFVFLRPASFDMMLWAPYRDYIQVDKLYGNVDDAFVWSQSVMNVVEVGLNLLALSYVSKKQYRTAAVVAIITSTMTCSKTILYHIIEIACGFCCTAHNDMFTLIMLYCLPNGVWIWVPATVVFRLGKLFVEETEAREKVE